MRPWHRFVLAIVGVAAAYALWRTDLSTGASLVVAACAIWFGRQVFRSDLAKNPLGALPVWWTQVNPNMRLHGPIRRGFRRGERVRYSAAASLTTFLVAATLAFFTIATSAAAVVQGQPSGVESSGADVSAPDPTARAHVVPPKPGKDFPRLVYPADAALANQHGTSIVLVCVDVKGALYTAPSIVLSSGYPSLDAAALRLAESGSGYWEPGTRDGVPEPMCSNWRIRFENPGSFQPSCPPAEDTREARRKRKPDETVIVCACVNAELRAVGKPTVVRSSGDWELDESAIKIILKHEKDARVQKGEGPVAGCQSMRFNFQFGVSQPPTNIPPALWAN